MSITDELRKWAGGSSISSWTAEHLTAIADRIDAEYQKAIRELNNLADASVLLPVDANGVPIHAGDDVEVVGYEDGTVVSVELYEGKKWRVSVRPNGWDTPTVYDAGQVRHRRPDTWEHIIEDATALGAQMGRRTTQVDDLVARCKALAGDAE